MKNTQENKLSMYYAVQQVCNTNNTVWNGLPAFATAFANFETSIATIKNRLEVQNKNVLGVSLDKTIYKTTMVDKALLVANAVYAYATDVNNFTLQSKVDFSKSDLARGRDVSILQNCELIKNEADAIITDLTDYGILAADITDLQNKIEAFVSANTAPRTAIIERKGATAEISQVLKAADTILKSKMDKLIESFKISNPRFYNLYFDARIIVDKGIRHNPVDEDEPPSPNTTS